MPTRRSLYMLLTCAIIATIYHEHILAERTQYSTASLKNLGQHPFGPLFCCFPLHVTWYWGAFQLQWWASFHQITVYSLNHHRSPHIGLVSAFHLIKAYTWLFSDRKCGYALDVNGGMWYKNTISKNWWRDKMAAISQAMFWNAFSWMKMYEFCLRCHQSLFPRVQLTIFQHWFRQWFGVVQATRHYMNQWLLVYWRIYESPGINELMAFNNQFTDFMSYRYSLTSML